MQRRVSALPDISIKNLYKKKLVSRGQTNLSGGGYEFFYFVKDKNKIKNEVKSILNNWVGVFYNRLDEW